MEKTELELIEESLMPSDAAPLPLEEDSIAEQIPEAQVDPE